MKIKILIAAHKPYWMPRDSVYFPLHVGAAGKADLGLTRDDAGENISAKNANYCELTGIYWAWKNLKGIDYIGLCHYRRYFAHRRFACGVDAKRRLLLNAADYERLLTDCECLLPQRRNYYIETVRSQYEHAHNKNDLAETQKIIEKNYPEYGKAFEAVMSRRTLHIYNMFVMKRELFDSYCKFLFGVLFALESRVDLARYNQYEARVFGFLGERLLDVWIEKNDVKYKEVPVVFLEKINWFSKGGKFLGRKFLGK